MIKLLIPPACFILALMLLAVAFSLIAIDGPDASSELHRARAAGDKAVTEVFEQDLQNRQFFRTATIVSAFAGSIAMTIVGFKTMYIR